MLAAVETRREVGRINDLIHAAAIVTLLPQILELDEKLEGRPSLAAGNDSTRLYDLTTDRRVAGFKFSEQKGPDAMRKRNTFKDLVTSPRTTTPDHRAPRRRPAAVEVRVILPRTSFKDIMLV